MKHLLSIEQTTKEDLQSILAATKEMKAQRGNHQQLPLEGQTWAMIFSKSSTRTRVSFETGIRELGGWVMFLSDRDIQMGRGEPIEDTARVMGRMVHGAVFRTYAQADVEHFAEYAKIPTINALTDEEHPCQILTDLFTIQEKLGDYEGKVVTFVGDGACNVPISWIYAAAKLGFELRIAAPKEFQPSSEVLHRAGAETVGSVSGWGMDGHFASGGRVLFTENLDQAAEGADVLYTDTLVSMGKEEEAADRIAALKDFQINNALVAKAQSHALVMHCLPAYRGKEITADTMETHAKTIFDQAENRLHTQKAILQWLVS
ncbi:MAG: ornithine carbamoyltransferase [Verrucomicrobiales bacterium]|nr:ornithine carbamoyltransferase [Verrucomicrobiales bacterium]|tara:strand:- start:7079 stop:8032 length:954 start_codon:yes stop_codon:yes gene_type:complete